MPSKRPKVRLPKIAKSFLRTKAGRRAKFLIKQLHRRMAEDGLALSQAQPADARRLVEELVKSPATREAKAVYRCQLLRYFDYLHAHGAIGFDPASLRLRPLHSKQQLPSIAGQFLQALRPTHKPATVTHYRGSLRKLYAWLARCNITASQLDRGRMTDFLQDLAKQKLQAGSRITVIVQVRVFLRWHHERAALPHHPDHLIRPSDLPKRPTYLPRPLPPAADRELQRRLSKSDGLYCQGLLLMRRTGLRIGELVTLDRDCLRSEPSGRRFLKVPLGKLANERLVPVDDQIVELIERLQSTGSVDRRWLLETPRGKRTNPARYRAALREAGEGLPTDGPLVTHRLRHSYATTLLSAGMSLVGVMKLLGHRDYRMTLRYAAITQETVTEEYLKALTKIEDRYKPTGPAISSSHQDPLRMLSDLVRWVKKHIGHEFNLKRAARALVKRIERIQEDLQRLTSRYGSRDD